MQMSDRRVLLISHVMPQRGGRGHTARLADLCRQLDSHGLRVSFLHVDMAAQDAAMASQSDGLTECERFEVDFTVPLWIKLLYRLKSRDFHREVSGPAQCPVTLQKRVVELVDEAERMGRPYGLVLANHHFVARSVSLLARRGRRPHLLIHPHDILHRRLEMVREYGRPSQWVADRDLEIEILSLYDSIMAIQLEEEQLIRSMLPERNVFTCGMSFPVVSTKRSQEGHKGPVVLIVAGVGAHNTVGMNYLLEYVWPEVQAGTPAATLRIAGAICGSLPADLPESVETAGYVEDIGDEYAGADVVVNPTFFGTGLKIKSVEAMAHGCPLVAHATGVEGLPDSPNVPAITVERKEEFANAISALLRDDSRRMELSKKSEEYASRWFAPDVVYRQLFKFLDSLPWPASS